MRQLKTVGNVHADDGASRRREQRAARDARHGQGMRTVLVTATRGDGGQNEIGPELFEALGVLRTEELLAVHRFDGAEQYFTRAVDFGFSFSVEETLEKWGHDEILGDFVRHDPHDPPRRDRRVPLRRRRRRPASPGLGAADARSVPRRGRSGEVPGADQRRTAAVAGEARVLYGHGELLGPCRDSEAGADARWPRDLFDPLLGRTYGELGIEARSMHKCQGTSQLLPLPGTSSPRTYRLAGLHHRPAWHCAEVVLRRHRHEPRLADGFAGSSPPAALSASVKRIADAVDAAERAATSGDRAGRGTATGGGPHGSPRTAP